MKLRDYIVRRLLLAIPVLFGVSILTFTISHVVGDPAAAWITDRTREDVRQRVIEQHGLDKPLPYQYLIYMRDLAKGDLGVSPTEGGRPVLDCMRDYLPTTIELSLTAFILLMIIGIPLGIISAIKKDRWPDHLSRFFALSGVSIPVFWFALLLQFVFFYELVIRNLPHLPLEGRYQILLGPPPRVTGFFMLDSILALNSEKFFDSLFHLILPAVTLAFGGAGAITRIMRGSMLEVIRQDYIRTARSKGLSERTVIYKHALRNAMIPTTTLSGLVFAGLLGGAPLTETVFNLPGLGRYAVRTMLATDFGGIMGVVLFFAVTIVAANLLVDILYSMLDPRIRLG